METVAERTSGGPDVGLGRSARRGGLCRGDRASYAPGATAEDRNMVFWKWGPDLPHGITVTTRKADCRKTRDRGLKRLAAELPLAANRWLG